MNTEIFSPIEGTINKPVLLVDVDGVLNPFNMKKNKVERKGFNIHSVVVPDDDTYEIFINPSIMKRLFDMQEVFDLVWCTTWNHWANKLILPLAGFDFPEFPVLELDIPNDYTPYSNKPFWKTPQVVEAFKHGEYAGRRFAWIDDSLNQKIDKPYLWKYFSDHQFKIGFCNPGLGLTEDLKDKLIAWATNSEEENIK